MVLLLGGGESWNQGWRREKLAPKEAPQFLDNMPSGYDERHNAIIFTDNNVPWAYRYKK